MSKKNIFIVIFFALITVASFATADYTDPTSSAPNNNTSPVLRTGPDTMVSTVEKIGTGDGTNAPSLSLLANGIFTNEGTYSDKLAGIGATIISDNFLIKAPSASSFDQYTNPIQNVTDPNTQTTDNTKPLEAILSGRLYSKKLVIANQETTNPTYDLELQSSVNPTFNPTTNIGLGDTCKLYPANLGADINWGQNVGCSGGMVIPGTSNVFEYDVAYMSMYKNPSWTGTLSASNNTNNQVVGICTFFNPSSTPTDRGDCYTDKTISTGVKTGGLEIGTYSGEKHYYFFVLTQGQTTTDLLTQTGPQEWRLTGTPNPVNSGRNPKYRLSEDCPAGSSYYSTATLFTNPILTMNCPTANWKPKIEIIDGYGQFKSLPFDQLQFSTYF